MNEIYCIYSGPNVEDGIAYGGTLTMKTPQGLALVAFASPALAQTFLTMTGLQNHQIHSVASLGNSNHPVKYKYPIPNPSLKIVFPSKEVLASWAKDKVNFDSAPYVTEFDGL